MSKLNPVTTHREFSGLPGTIAITFGLAGVILAFGFLINETYCIDGVNIQWDEVWKQVPLSKEDIIELFFDKTTWVAYLIWFSILAVLDIILPGKEMKGITLRDGTQLDYKINGWPMIMLLLTILTSRLAISSDYYLPELAFLYNNHLKLTGTTIAFSFILATLVYIASFIPLRGKNGMGTKERILSINGNTGSPFYDWFIGRELNPRIGYLDIKLFCELRPGLLLWFLINLSCIHHQYHKLGFVSDSLILVNVLQAFYIVDGVQNEEGVLSMIDITTDGFGYMLCFGDLAWLPISYCLQARYLLIKPLNLGITNCLLVNGVMALGFYIFHLANQQKSDFKQGKLDHLNLKLIKTKTGSKLLCDGWWGLSQHINYLGDWFIGWSWCLTTGFETPLTYFYVIYFGSLLFHRQTRDEMKCRAKYGSTWEEYERKVPYKIIPYIY
ncbi:erg24, C-14 sterol reductase [Scheffersomyces spartinae]|uniref:Delta(14)-sterol reductase n=1 Tax=Scheffersomyces spartinae TaxID=45513 RepID=A0A9P7VCD3_9ASCO|nr:erg24, C-14 sterol reductase [Scheffersomyces spartinae]KAG7195379.1 erg24, C-14 sterol reductase [Scheffersomyces spartinae]